MAKNNYFGGIILHVSPVTEFPGGAIFPSIRFYHLELPGLLENNDVTLPAGEVLASLLALLVIYVNTEDC